MQLGQADRTALPNRFQSSSIEAARGISPSSSPYLYLSLARALAHALGLVTSRVLEDTIDTPTGSNGVLPSLFVSLSLSVFFSFCLWLSLTRRSCLALSLARGLQAFGIGTAYLFNKELREAWEDLERKLCRPRDDGRPYQKFEAPT